MSRVGGWVTLDKTESGNCKGAAAVNMAGETNQSLDELVQLQCQQLVQQGRSINIGRREERLKSRDRLQGFFEDLQAILTPEMTLEIGAHAAPFSQRMSLRGIEAHAFEANPYNHKAFAGRMKRRAPAVKYHHLAMSDTDGHVTFQVKESRGDEPFKKISGNNSLLQRTAPGITYESVTVPSVRLDSFLAANGLEGRSFSAWIDVEGALGMVTAGFGAALRSCLSLIVEVEDHSFWQGQMLVQDAMRYFAGQGLVPIARDFEALHQYNLLYLRKDMADRPDVAAATSRYLQDL
ncbi:MAG: FkbM family methyltransferase [Rhodobacterales bacterium]|nr:FkbM family methyltransferase [Rhodobacterales bacterium]